MQSNHDKLFEDGQVIAVGSSRSIRFIRQSDIVYLQSDGCYTKIHLNDNSCFIVCRILKNYEAELNKQLFFRCHKSFLVNRHYIKGILRKNSEFLVLHSGIQIPIARRKFVEIKRIMLPGLL